MGTALRLTAKNQVTLKKSFCCIWALLPETESMSANCLTASCGYGQKRRKLFLTNHLGISPVVWATRMMSIYPLTS